MRFYTVWAISGSGNRGWATLQNGIKQHSFCEVCEQHFNKHFETPFLEQWVRASPLPDPWRMNDVHWAKFDYSAFKLFHLSVLFRASVCSLPTFSDVPLGPHEERIRKMLLTCDAGTQSEYPIFGYAVIHHENHQLIRMVSRAGKSRINGHRCWGIMYGGVQWWISVSSHRNYEFEHGGLQADGRMPFHAVPWNNVDVIQAATQALRGSGSKMSRK